MSDIVKLKDSNNVEYNIKDIVSEYITANALEPYLTIETAERTYVSYEDLAGAVFDLYDINSNPYLTKEDAADRYLLKEDGVSTSQLATLSSSVDTLESENNVQNGAISRLQDKITPALPTTNGQYVLKHDNDTFTWHALNITGLPSTTSLAAGEYTLKCTIDANHVATFTWVAASSSAT